MTSQSSGGSGSGLPGVTSDGQTPGGEIIAGALTAGDPNAASVPSFNNLWGATSLGDTPANSVDGDDVLYIQQSGHGAGAFAVHAVNILRSARPGGAVYARPMVSIGDGSGSDQATLVVSTTGGTQFQVDGDGVQVHGKFKSGASVTHTLGSYSGKSVPIYDEAGTLLGYMPLYA